MVHLKVGQKATVTAENIQLMIDSNRSVCHPNYPTSVFIASISNHEGADGVVTHVFPPGYEVSVQFADLTYHLKGHWVTPKENV